MPHFETFYDRQFLGSWDLVDAKGNPIEVTVTIARVEAKQLTNQKGTEKKPVIYFEGKEKGFVSNKTNSRTIAGMYGNKTEAWIGKRITLYATTTSVGGAIVDAIRVRPQVPPEKGKTRQPGEEG